jgi:very-short-patch-repair endonuclease
MDSPNARRKMAWWKMGDRNPSKWPEFREKLRLNNPAKRREVRAKMSIAARQRYLRNPALRAKLARMLAGYARRQAIEHGGTKLEQKVAFKLRGAGLKFVHQLQIDTFVVDFAIPSLKVVIEADGEYWHSLRDPLRERHRDAVIRSHGWKIIHVPEGHADSFDPATLTTLSTM